MGIELSTEVTLAVPGFPGVAVVVTKPESMREFFLMRRFGELGGLDEDHLEQIEEALVLFGNTFLVSWNVDRRGQPVEPNGEGLASLPATFQFALLSEWMKAVRGVGEIDGPLGNGSTGGPNSPTQPTAELESE